MSILAQDTIVISPATVNRIESEIDEIRNNTDVADVVANYAELEAYDTSKLTDNAIIKVLSDEEHENAQTYYRWSVSNQEFSFIGSIGPFYTKAESDELLSLKQNRPSSAIQNNIATWDNDRHTVDSGKSFTTSVADESTASDNKISTEKAVRTELDTKVDKTTSPNRIYGTSSGGDQSTYSISKTNASVNAIVQRDSAGCAYVATPTVDGHATTKKYVDDADATKVTKNADITAGTHTKITYDSKGLVTGGTDIVTADVTDLTATASEINQLHSSSITTADLTKLHNVTADATELNVLDGITASTTELNYVDGVTSAIQTQLDNKVDKTNAYWQVYATNNSGQTTLSYSSVVSANSIAQRDANSQININLTPTADNNATSKKYVDDKVTAAVTEAVVFKGVVADQTALPQTGNTNGDMYWITAFVSPAPTGMTVGRSGSAIYKGDPDNKFEYTEDAIYQPDEQTIDLNGNGKLYAKVSEVANNSLTTQNDGLHVDISGKVDKVSNASKVYGTDASSNQTTYDISNNVTANTIAYRGSGGRLAVGTPTTDVNATTKKYVDDADALKQNKSTLIDITGLSVPLSVADNCIYNGGEFATLTFQKPLNAFTTDYEAQVNFTSGSTPTVITVSDPIIWLGDNVNEDTGFQPRANCRYSIVFTYDGVNWCGMIRGVSL